MSEHTEDERLRTCGQHPTLGDVSNMARACGRVLSAGDLFRCADCRTAFCRDCIRRHFKDESPEGRRLFEAAETRALQDTDRCPDMDSRAESGQ